MIISIDGKLIDENERFTIYPKCSALMYGKGVFETILIKNGVPCFLNEHLERLFKALDFIDLKNDKEKESIEADLYETITVNDVFNGSARITVLGSAKESHVILTVDDGFRYPDYLYIKGFKLISCEYKNNPYSPLTYIKSCNYLNNIMARREAVSKGGDEGLILNVFGQVAEGAVSNIFVVNENNIYTPPVEVGLLPGIVRKILLHKQKEAGFTITEKKITYSELIKADEVFITNSLLGIMPVVSIDGHIISDDVTEKHMTVKLLNYYKKLLDSNL